MVTLPRLVLAAPGSGQGKTTVAIGLMAALGRRGLAVAGFKVGPDYIDPGYHTLATGRPGRNLDPFLVGEALVAPLLAHGAATPAPCDVAVIEGVMGLFDGRVGTDGFASTAHVALLTDSPVVLVVDASHTSRTVGAVAHGLATYDAGVRVAGVILNKVGSATHASEAVAAVERAGLRVLGVLPRTAGIEAPSRHLGLVPVAERADAAASLDVLAARITECISLDAVLAVAASAPDLDAEPWDPAAVVRTPSQRRPVVAVAGGRAFTFRYPETEELLRAAGCDVAEFDPLTASALPAGTAGLYLGGGFPEVHAADLSANATLRTAVRAAVDAGLPTVAECAGLLYLASSLDGQPMVGAVPAAAGMHPRLVLGYREATAVADTLLARAGEAVTGHEFHRTRTPLLDGSAPAWSWSGPDGPVADGVSLDPARTGRPTVHASYLHTHWAGHPGLAQRFAEAVHTHALSGTVAAGAPDTSTPRSPVRHPPEPDLLHHGDRDLRPGLVDLAVNVRVPHPPAWLVDALAASLASSAAYPDARRAREAIARRHGVGEAMVLPTAGAAEASTLVARGLAARRAVVVHPQFTEPEAALRRAGVAVVRHLLRAADGFVLDPDAVPDGDLVLVGNPTNPTSVLHPADALRRLARPGRVVVVDEAFLDAVPGEPESLISREMAGVLVVRSLTKTWGLAGVRAGYVVGDPALVGRLAAQQPPWSVSSPALVALEACLTPRALTEARALAEAEQQQREHLVQGLTRLGLRPVLPARAPFVLVDAAALAPASGETVRDQLARRGFAVRRGDSFPGLGPSWIRVAVRAPRVTDEFLETLASLR